MAFQDGARWRVYGFIAYLRFKSDANDTKRELACLWRNLYGHKVKLYQLGTIEISTYGIVVNMLCAKVTYIIRRV